MKFYKPRVNNVMRKVVFFFKKTCIIRMWHSLALPYNVFDVSSLEIFLLVLYFLEKRNSIDNLISLFGKKIKIKQNFQLFTDNSIGSNQFHISRDDVTVEPNDLLQIPKVMLLSAKHFTTIIQLKLYIEQDGRCRRNEK